MAGTKNHTGNTHVCVRVPVFWHVNPTGRGWSWGDEAARLKGGAASLLRRSREHGKANTEWVSKTSKGGRFLPKQPAAPVLLSLPPFLSPPRCLPCAAPPPTCLSSPSIPSSSLQTGKVSPSAAATPLLPPVSAVPGVKTPGILPVGPAQEQRRAAEPPFTRAFTHTHAQSFVNGYLELASETS